MLLYRLAFSPNGQLDAERLDTDDIDPGMLAPFDPLFANGLSFNAPMPGALDVAVKWTGSEGGQALLSCSRGGRLFLSGALVAGRDAAGDAEVLWLFSRWLESVPLLQQIAGGRPNPFAALLDRPERPLLAGVVWPTLPADVFAEVAGLDVLLSAVFLRRIGPGIQGPAGQSAAADRPCD
jgi:hypothetical protein